MLKTDVLVIGAGAVGTAITRELTKYNVDVICVDKNEDVGGDAVGALMSGSGPSVVGFFAREQDAKRVRNAIAAQGIAAFVCKPLR